MNNTNSTLEQIVKALKELREKLNTLLELNGYESKDNIDAMYDSLASDDEVFWPQAKPPKEVKANEPY